MRIEPLIKIHLSVKWKWKNFNFFLLIKVWLKICFYLESRNLIIYLSLNCSTVQTFTPPPLSPYSPFSLHPSLIPPSPTSSSLSHFPLNLFPPSSTSLTLPLPILSFPSLYLQSSFSRSRTLCYPVLPNTPAFLIPF